jgi:hypothetical protein
MHSGWRTGDYISVDDAIVHMKSGANVGVRLRAEDLIVDVDPRNFAEGDDPLARLEADLGVSLRDNWPTVLTGSGGYHIYMRKPPEASVRDTLEDYQGIEFKTVGRQVVAAGSVHDTTFRPYQWLDPELMEPLTSRRMAPPFLLELIKRPGRVSAVDAGSRTPEEIERLLEPLDPRDFREYNEWLTLMLSCHHASAGEARQEFISWSILDEQYADQAAVIGRKWDGMHADNSERRVTEKYLFKVLHKAGQGTLVAEVTKTSAEEDFDDLPEGEDLEELLANLPDGDPSNGPLEAFNAAGYAAVNDNGRFLVYRMVPDYEWENADGNKEMRMRWETYRKGDFLDIHSNKNIQKTVGAGDRTTVVNLAQEWLRWGNRTSYDAVVFDPGRRIGKGHKVLNLWTDWSVQPKKGDWGLLRKLLHEGLCAGDDESFEYVLDWAAYMIQHPDKRAEVAVVFKGLKGTGKGTWGKVLAKLAGRHGMHISNQTHLTNHFNAHLRDCVFLFADEAMWAGDKRGEGELKRLITEPTITIEAKGKDAITARNMLHVMMASNEDWVVPASMEDERRFAVFDVDPKFRGNRTFFDALYKQLDDGGLAAILWDLKARDLSKFHPRSRVPMTRALADQKLRSLDYFDQWWYECLCRGSFGMGVHSVRGQWDGPAVEEAIFFRQDVQNAFMEFLGQSGDRHRGKRSLSTTIGERLLKRVPTLKGGRVSVPSDFPGSVEADSHNRAYAYKLPSVSECRRAFEHQLGAELSWEEKDELEGGIDPLEDDLDPLA